MLVRGANAVGYTSYHDSTVAEFIAVAADRGIDVFRIFDCFNDVSQMTVCIEVSYDCPPIVLLICERDL